MYTWTKDLETGNALIDSQHKQLIEAVNRLLEACTLGKGRAEIEKTMRFLGDYTKKHFSDEERLQIRSRYPDYTNHRRYHEEFKKVVAGFEMQLAEEGPTVALVAKLNTSIAGWLLNHIKKEDVKVAAHVRGVG